MGCFKKQKRKEAKKQKKKSKHTAVEPSGNDGGGGVGDLLDLGGFLPVAEVSTEHKETELLKVLTYALLYCHTPPCTIASRIQGVCTFKD